MIRRAVHGPPLILNGWDCKEKGGLVQATITEGQKHDLAWSQP